jgi:hypothetical protein
MPLVTELLDRMFARVTFLPTLAYNLAMERVSARFDQKFDCKGGGREG